jgi:hypothetical protein
MLTTYLTRPAQGQGELQLRRRWRQKQKSPQQGGLCLKLIGLVMTCLNLLIGERAGRTILFYRCW